MYILLKKGISFPFKVLLPDWYVYLLTVPLSFLGIRVSKKGFWVQLELLEKLQLFGLQKILLRIGKQTRRSFNGPSHQILYQDSVAA